MDPMEKFDTRETVISFEIGEFTEQTKLIKNQKTFADILAFLAPSDANDFEILKGLLSGTTTKLTETEREYFSNSKYIANFLKQGNTIEILTNDGFTNVRAVDYKDLSKTISLFYKSVHDSKYIIDSFININAKLRQQQAKELEEDYTL